MPEVQLQLFRIQVYISPQIPLFQEVESERVTTAALMHAIESKPTIEGRGNVRWHLGNIERLGLSALYFAVGRTTRRTEEFYDEETRDFVEGAIQSAPYTHVVVDLELEVCAIAARTRVGRSPAVVAKQLERLLNQYEPTPAGESVSFDVTEIADPDSFVRRVTAAYAVTSFGMTFRLPNAWDADDFLKPHQRLVAEIRARRGRTELAGPNLKKEVVADLARSTAATGDDAHATVVQKPKSSPVRITLRKNNVLFSSDEPETTESRILVLETMRAVYRRIRTGESPKEV
jgi:AcrR family transcriptional regulator